MSTAPEINIRPCKEMILRRRCEHCADRCIHTSECDLSACTQVSPPLVKLQYARIESRGLP